jgi:hypothetical protein
LIPRSEDSDLMKIVVILAAVVVAGVYLRWAIRPVLVAYEVGRRVERMLTTLNDGGTALDGAGHKEH